MTPGPPQEIPLPPPTLLELPAVILAAGFGSRLGPSTYELAKSLVPVLGRPLLSYTLEGLAYAGVRETYVVVGHRGDQVRDRLARMDTYGVEIGVVDNPSFALPNGSSLAAARTVVAERPFLLLMADHLLSSAAIERMLGSPHNVAVGIDRTPFSGERLKDATKVLTRNDGTVTAIGKRLTVWDGVDAGIFRCPPSIFDVVDRVGQGSELSIIMTALAARCPFYCVDLTGTFWLDVDTPGDLAEAEAVLRNAPAFSTEIRRHLPSIPQ